MQRFKEWLKPIKDYFLNSFSETSQLFLSNFLGDYLEDPKQLNILTLIKGIDKLQLNIKYINQLFGCNPFNFEDAYIKSLKISNLKFEAEKITFILVLREKSDDELKQHLQNLIELRQYESAKINYLQKLRQEVYKRNQLEQIQGQTQTIGSGLMCFLSLADTLLSNLSISIKNIQILVKLEQGVQYEILINGINLELNKANTNNILNITTIIDLIELKIKNEIIALMEKAMKLQMIVETKDNNQVKLKINCIVSYLDFVLNKKQIKTIIKSFASYGSKIDQTNKTLIMLQHQAQASVVAQKDKRNFQLFEIKDFEVLNIELLKSKELNSVSNNSSQEILQSLYLDEEGTNCSLDQNMKNQKEQFKCYFQGIKLAICENPHYFPLVREIFFQDLESHFFIEITDIVTEYNQMCFRLNIQRMAAYRIKLTSPPFKFNLRSSINSVQNSEIFFSCKPIQKQVFLVTPVVLIGQHKLQNIECDFSIYNYENFLQLQSDNKDAIDLNISVLKCKNKKLFYSVKAEFSQIVASFRHESIFNLMTYLPKRKIQQLPQQKTDFMCGFEINVPEIKLSYFINNQTLTFKSKGITFKQKPTKIIELKTCILEPFEEIQYFENPIKLIIIVFNQIELKFQEETILRIDQGNINNKHTYPTIYIVMKDIKQIKKDRFNELESLFNYKKQKCDLIISGLIPNIELQLSDNFLQWMISLQEYQQKLISQQIQNLKNKSFRHFYQLRINQACIGIQDKCLNNLFYLELKTVNIVKVKSILILIQDIIAIDSQSLIPQNGEQKYKNFESAQIILYSMKNEINSVEQKIKNDQIEISNNPLLIDYQKYIIQVYFEQTTTIKMKNLCLRIPDFQFKSLKKMGALFNQYKEVQDQMEQNWLSRAQIIDEGSFEQQQHNIILEEDIFIDVFPINSVETFSDQNHLQNQLVYSNSRILFRVNNSKICSVIELSNIDMYFIEQNKIEKQFPLILNGFFDNKSHILQFGSQLRIKNVKYKDEQISIEQIIGNFKYDIIQSIMQITRDLSKLIPQNNKQVSDEQYKISQDFNQQLINQKIIEEIYLLNVGYISIELEQGVTYYEIDFIYDDNNEQDDQFNQSQDSDKICFNFTKCFLKVEMYKEGQIGIRYKSNFEIQDKIDKFYHKLVLSPDFQEFEFQDNSPLNFGLIIENQAYTGFISMVPMKIYISGSLLQFIINFMSNKTIIEQRINQDEIEIIQDVLPIIWLKSLQIYQTRFNITYDSQGLKVDGLLKGLLKISSFCNLQITLKDTEIQCKGDLKDVQQQIIENIQESFGSKYQIAGKALQSLDAFTQLKYLGRELLNLFISPFENIVESSSSRIDLSKSLNDVLLNLKNGQQVIQNFKFSSLPSRFLKRY
ncbi:unnamed protein product [Paramecium pentaurelia]|uniref:Uncharacterized protein n=1 Tax=Paramecium pentaurelia TaxID=43138 RepID=A0A8S1UFT1_9CILI|nr:unnamed protein product [Paramecium pentaurelia]